MRTQPNSFRRRSVAVIACLTLTLFAAGQFTAKRVDRSGLGKAHRVSPSRPWAGYPDRPAPTLTAAERPRELAVAQAYARLPLSFEANVGQVGGQTDPQVKFLSRGSGYTLFLTAREAVLALENGSQKSKLKGQKARVRKQGSLLNLAALPGSLPPTSADNFAPRDAARIPDPETRAPAVLRMSLVSANPNPQVAGMEELPGKSNYFLGNDPKNWRTDVPNYARVRYQEVYPGVDLVYYGRQGQLEYDFVVAPGADPRAIGLDVGRVGNAPGRPLRIDPQGDLVVPVEDAEVRFHKPVVYQTTHLKSPIPHRRFIDGHYVLKGDHQIGFELAAYDATEPLVIDPELGYSTYLGGCGQDFGKGIVVDSAGNAYVAGFTGSTDFPTHDPFQARNAGSPDAFVSKLNPAGDALVYSTYLGGTADDEALSIAVDGGGNAYVTGFTYSTNFPTKNAFQASNAGAPDAFLTKLNPAGDALVYSTYLGGSAPDFAYSIAVDSAGSAYVTGITRSNNFPTQNAFQSRYGGGLSEAFVTKFDAAGNGLVYSTYLGGSNGAEALGIAVDSAGSAYVTGDTYSTNFPITSGAFQTACGGNCAFPNTDAFVTKFSAGGNALVYSTYLGGNAQDEGTGIAVDGAGNAYVTGWTSSGNFPTKNPFQPIDKGSPDAFVTALNAAGNGLVYSTYLGGKQADYGHSIAVDGAGNAYVTGWTNSTNFPTTSNALQASSGGGADAFLAKFDASGTALLSTYFGGAGNDYGEGIAVDTGGNAYVTGWTYSANFPTQNPFQSSIAGGEDAFVSKFLVTANPVPYVNQPLVPASTAPGGPAFTLTVNGTGFVFGARVNWNGAPLATTFVRESQLTAKVPAANIACRGTASVTVVNPNAAPLVGTSNVVFFPINTPEAAVVTSAHHVAVGVYPEGGAVGDFNGDGKLDLAIANSSGGGPGNLSILLGNGDGTFTAAPSPSTGAWPVSVVVGDFNGDGIPDLAVANGWPTTGNTVTILLGDGKGGFTEASSPAAGEGPVSLAVGDFNGDGKLDLAVADWGSDFYGSTSNGTVTILLGNGDGTFTAAPSSPTVGLVPVSVVTGDFNGDGKLDLAVYNWIGGTVTILLGNGDGTFTAAPKSPVIGAQPGLVVGDFNEMAVGDFNGDGKLDLAVVNSATCSITILLGNGDGTFTPTASPPATGLGPGGVAVGDFNDDGKLDLAVANWGYNYPSPTINGNVTFLLGNGDGTFTANSSPPTTIEENPVAVLPGDFTGSGRLGVAVVNENSDSVSVLLQGLPTTGMITFGSSVATTNNSGSPTIAVPPNPAWASALPGSIWISYTEGSVPNAAGTVLRR
jgi:hypothetical protein